MGQYLATTVPEPDPQARAAKLEAELSASAPGEQLPLKRIVCCLINGFSKEKVDILHKFTDMKTGTHDRLKPQYIHSAISIQLMRRFPWMRPEAGSWFRQLATNEARFKQYDIISTHVLQDDEDGRYFLENANAYFGKAGDTIVLRDESNQSERACRSDQSETSPTVPIGNSTAAQSTTNDSQKST